MKKLLLLTFSALFLMHPLSLSAQSSSSDAAIKNTLGIGPRLGYYKANDAESGNFYGGLQTRIRLGPVFGLEGSIEYRAGQEYEFGTETVKTKFVPVTASVLMFLPLNESIAPYGVAGLGAYYTIYDYEGTFTGSENNEFNMGYHLGFGVEFPMDSNTALNFDYRYLFLNPDSNESSLDDTSYSGNVFTAGIMFYL